MNARDDDRQRLLFRLDAEIAACVRCAPLVGTLLRPSNPRRGSIGARVMIVGQGPGRTEVSKGDVFAGQAGKTLDRWLTNCGAPASEPRSRVYLTSLLKCVCPDQKHFDRMASQCINFLARQIGLIRPQLVITLGLPAYEALADGEPYGAALCTLRENTSMLIPSWRRGFLHLVWPHPSGLNRWLNDPEHRKQLTDSFAHVRPFLLETSEQP
jgi:uracil-DNA glycosylase family 4